MEVVIGIIIFIAFIAFIIPCCIEIGQIVSILCRWRAIIRKENKEPPEPPKPPPIPYEPTEFVKDACMWWTYSKSTKEEILLNASNEDIMLWYRELVNLRFQEECMWYLRESEERIFSFKQAYEEIAEEISRRNLGPLAKKIYKKHLIK